MGLSVSLRGTAPHVREYDVCCFSACLAVTPLGRSWGGFLPISFPGPSWSFYLRFEAIYAALGSNELPHVFEKEEMEVSACPLGGGSDEPQPRGSHLSSCRQYAIPELPQVPGHE